MTEPALSLDPPLLCTNQNTPTFPQVRTLREIEPQIADKFGPGLDGKVRAGAAAAARPPQFAAAL